MAKKRKIAKVSRQESFPFEKRFNNWLAGIRYKNVKKHTKESSDSYLSYINTLNRNVFRVFARDGISALDTHQSMSFDDFFQIVSRYLDIVRIHTNFNININTLYNCRSAFLAYVEYLYIYKDTLEKEFPQCTTQTVISDYIPEEYNHASMTFTKRMLLKNFSFRLATQDRTTGDKVLLPLGLIRMIFTRTKTGRENKLDQWAHDCAEKIIIHISDKNGDDLDLTLNEIKSLMINPDSGEVEVVKGNSRYIVKTQQGDKDADLKPMRAHCLSAIHIDHAQAIDVILKEPSLADQLLSLQKLTEWLHDAEKEFGKFKVEDKSKFYNWVIDHHTGELQEISASISDDLAKIAEWQELQLMGAKENSQASNK